MRKGKYYRYLLKTLYYLFEKEPENFFNLSNRCASIADNLIIPKTSFFDVLRVLEELEYVSITRATEWNVQRRKRYGYFAVVYFQKVRITPKGVRFYLSEFEHLTRT